MKNKVKSMELVTAPLTWCNSMRGEAVKREGERRRRTRKRTEIIGGDVE